MNSEALEQIRNFYRIDDRIATAGQPTVDQFNNIKLANFDLVINLALPDPPDAIEDEGDLMDKLGMDYIHIPVDFKAPTLDDLNAFFNAVDQNRDKRVFIHCALNLRVSAFMFLYRRIRQHISASDALPGLQAIWKPDITWQQFIASVLAHYQIRD
ncbi:MAG: protein tyrosine phosphatase family protein [Gammaproteobacteria bacterium]